MPLPTPAPFSIRTRCPPSARKWTPDGATATRYSSFLVSLGMPTTAAILRLIPEKISGPSGPEGVQDTDGSSVWKQPRPRAGKGFSGIGSAVEPAGADVLRNPGSDGVLEGTPGPDGLADAPGLDGYTGHRDPVPLDSLEQGRRDPRAGVRGDDRAPTGAIHGHEPGELENPLHVPPSEEVRQGVLAHDEEELGAGIQPLEDFQRVDRVGGARAVDLDRAYLQALLVLRGEPRHGQAVGRRSLGGRLVGRHGGGDEEHPVEAVGPADGPGHGDVPAVNGIEGAAERSESPDGAQG